MLARIVCFSVGILCLLWLPELPDWRYLWLIPLLLLLSRYQRFFITPFWFLLGMAWAGLHAGWWLHYGIDPENEKQDKVIRGEIVSLPEDRGRGMRFLFSVDEAEGLSRPLGKIQLSWYGHVPDLQIGQRWQLKVRLKRPNGFVNPAGFDYEGWLFQQRIRATGYVRSGAADRKANQLLSQAEGHWIDRQRQWIGEGIKKALGQSQFTGLIQALAIGQRQLISDQQWQILTATGTNHLMAISGLHIGLAAGLGMWLIMMVWRCSAQLCLWLPARKAGAVAGLTAALFYAALAGFAIPTQRALIMLMVALGGVLLQRQLKPAQILASAWLTVLLLDPFAMLSIGFWLSFGAVAILLYTMSGRSHTGTFVWRWGRVHWVVAIGLIPILLFAFQQAPFYSFLANFIAVPVISLLVVPMVLLAALLMPISSMLSGWLLQLAAWLFQWLWPVLEEVASLPFSQWLQHQPVWWSLPCAVLGAILLLAPKGWPGRWLGVLWLLPMLLIAPPRPLYGELWLTVLDVGQGLSVVVRTVNHTLVYDTGPSLGSMDAGKMVLLPYLQSQGINRLQRLVLSHDDRDHTGGADVLIDSIDVDQLMSPGIDRYMGQSHQTCRSGNRWQWDGVEFILLHPESWQDWREDNNRSCVLQIRAAGGSVLIPGDIEKRVEGRLVSEYAEALQSDILLAGHHGSKSSSSAAFLQAVDPEYVVYASGYLNRYGFPHPKVTEQVAKLGARELNSAESGAIRFKILPQQGILTPQEFRAARARLWRRR